MKSEHPSGSDLHVVTGAFGYAGRHITQALLDQGLAVRTITGRPEHREADGSVPFDGRVEARPFRWDDPAALAESLRGARVLHTTYWVRFAHGRVDHGLAVERNRLLVRAAVEAGIERIVHVSITQPSEDSHLPYFRGKAQVERAIRDSGLSHAILRPTVFFGGRDVLINNIAWLMRRFPVFGVPRGDYRLQPIHVADLGRLAVEQALSREDIVLDAVGPEIHRFADLVRLVGRAVGSRTPVIPVPHWLSLAAARAIGRFVDDVVLTRDEVDGLTADLLVSADPPTGTTRFSTWLDENADGLGLTWASELRRHYVAHP